MLTHAAAHVKVLNGTLNMVDDLIWSEKALHARGTSVEANKEACKRPQN